MQQWNISINFRNFISFLKWMCSTKMLLKSFADSDTPKTSTCLLFIIILKEQWNFSKFAVIMDPLGVIVSAPMKKLLFGVITKKATRWYGATFWSLPMKFETSEPRLMIVFSTLFTNLSKVFDCLNYNLTIEKLKTK